MQTYTVIWRDDGDDFMVTEMEVDENVAGYMTAQDFVMAAAAVEYADFEDAQECLDSLEENGYDLVGVIFGKAVWIH